MTASADQPVPGTPGRPRRIILGLTLFILVLAGAIATVRYAVLTQPVRTFVEARADGLRVGQLGQLRIDGLAGDLWRDVSARRVTLRDAKGVWLQADNVRVRWDYRRLFTRRFEADRIEATRVQVFRRPQLSARRPQRDLPVSIAIRDLRTRLVLDPAFSRETGDYDVRLNLDIERKSPRSGQLLATSRLHAGDQLRVAFQSGVAGTFAVNAGAEEARGGALAGAFGLPSDQPFRLAVQGAGSLSNGRFTARATSGTATPLDAKGAWTPKGGQATGRVSLTASSHTTALASRLGPELLFTVLGRRAGPDLYDLDARFTSEAFGVRARGLGNPGKLSLAPKGLQIVADAPSLSRLTGGPASGPGRLVGVVTGAMKAWAFKGTASLQSLDLGVYRLARVVGPVEFSADRGTYALKATASSTGGQGSGFVAALLGGAPTAKVEVERLQNGQLVVRRLDVGGRELTLQASGNRSLLGTVGIKAKAQIADLSAARAGASGGVVIEGSASQVRAGQPWLVSLTGQGDRLALGIAELDRLMGTRPRAEARAEWLAGRLQISRARLDGAALDATAAGTVGSDGNLALRSDWTATGPFRAGPLEISGRARGDGTVTGDLTSPRLVLAAELEQIDVPHLPMRNGRLTLVFQRQPDGSSGNVSLVAESAYGPARIGSDFRFPRGGLDLSDLVLDAGGVRASGTLSLSDRAPSAANLNLDIGPGALLDAGRMTGTARIVDAGGGARAALNLTAERLRARGSSVTVRAARLAADGPLARLPYSLEANGASGQGAWTVKGQGLLTDAAPGYGLTIEGRGTLGARDLHTVEPAVFRLAESTQSARVRLEGSDGGKLDLDGVLNGEAADVRVRVVEMGLNLVDADFDGRVDANLALQGRGDQLSGVLEARLMNARGRGTPAVQGIDGTVRGRLAGDRLTLDLTTAGQQGLKGEASLILPTESSARPLRVAVARQRPLQGRFAAEGEVRPLWELMIGGERSLSGFVRTNGVLGGTLARPQATGRIDVERGRFDDGASGLSLKDVALQASFGDDAVNVTSARGVDGRGGQLTGQGRISLLPDGVSNFRLDLEGFRLIDNETATATATGQATINRAADGKVKLSGNLSIDRGDVAADPPVPSGVVAMDVREVNRPYDLPVAFEGARKKGDGWALDVNLKAPRRVFLRGRGLDVEFSLDAHVGGTTANANLTGTARVVRGDYDFAGKRFAIDDTSIVYLASKPQNIRLQLDATREDPSLKVTVRIRGTAARPEIALVSSPSLPNDEILSKVLFERSASQLSPVEAAQLASALSSLTGGGGLDVIGNLKSFAGLDRLAFGGGQQTGVTVSGGKYLTDDIYLELTGGGREGPSAQVEWRIGKSLSILSRLAGQAGNRLAVRWRKDY